MSIRIEGIVSDADTSQPVKDIIVRLIHDRTTLCQYLTGKDGAYVVESQRKKPGLYEIELHCSETMDDYHARRESIEIDSLPYQSRLDFSLLSTRRF